MPNLHFFMHFHCHAGEGSEGLVLLVASLTGASEAFNLSCFNLIVHSSTTVIPPRNISASYIHSHLKPPPLLAVATFQASVTSMATLAPNNAQATSASL